jgi:hypothetical protein
MKSVRKRLTYANVMSSIAVFLVVAGGSAVAANQLGKNTVGSKQLKKNAVTAAKIKNGAVTGGKLAAGAVSVSQLGAGSVNESKLADGAVGAGKLANGSVGGSKIAPGAVGGGQLADGSVTTSKIAPGAVTGDQINVASTPFGRITERIRNGSAFGLQTSGQFVPIGSYTQPANEDDTYFGSVEVNFAATCVAPRSATVYLVIDPTNLSTLVSASEIAGYGVLEDKGTGAATRTLEVGDFPGLGAHLGRMGGSQPKPHSFYFYTAGGTCTSGSGITGSNAAVDVVGSK